ncbi:MAG: hypothetical protein P4L79_10855 [Legionella sp.]|uniref:hypothetical protein n=1 Tax=Legionella sp. TaxID=459 RepID=UPI0028489E16|nr:hypothetical protein [Legionella sp.]
MASRILVSYEEKQNNKLLIQKHCFFDFIEDAYKFSRRIYMSGVSKTKPVIERAA